MYLNYKHIEGFGKYVIYENGDVGSVLTNRIKLLKTKINNWGYKQIGLYNDIKQIFIPIHILVAEAYIGIIPDGYEVNHKDGDKLNNLYTNLEIVTPKENTAHAFRIGLRCGRKGSKHHNARLNENDVLLIKMALFNNICSRKELSILYEVSPSLIRFIDNGKRWGHVKYPTI